VENTPIGRVISEIGQRCKWAFVEQFVVSLAQMPGFLSGSGEEAGDVNESVDVSRSNPKQRENIGSLTAATESN